MPFCRSCGNEVETEDRFCEHCGTARAPAAQAAPTPRALSDTRDEGFTSSPPTGTQQVAPSEERTATPQQRPDGKLPCEFCGVRVAAENMDYHLGNAHRRAVTATAGADNSASVRPDAGVAGKVACLECGVLIAPDMAEYHRHHAHSARVQSAPYQSMSVRTSDAPVQRGRSAGLRTLRAVGALLVGWVVLGTLLAFVAAFVAPGAEYYMGAVGFVIGVVLAVRSWRYYGRPRMS